MHDLAKKWPVPPVWETALLERGGLVVRVCNGLSQLYVSGEMRAFCQREGISGSPAGAFATVSGERYAVSLSRNAMLAVSETPFRSEEGWRDGCAITSTHAGLVVLELVGEGLLELIEQATTLPIDGESASATMSFAGIGAVAYFHDRALRIHVERSLAPYLWDWLGRTTGPGSHPAQDQRPSCA